VLNSVISNYKLFAGIPFYQNVKYKKDRIFVV
jgi:hypothetical protein